MATIIVCVGVPDVWVINFCVGLVVIKSEARTT